MSYDSVEYEREYKWIRVCEICKNRDLCRLDHMTNTFKCAAHGGYVVKGDKTLEAFK